MQCSASPPAASRTRRLPFDKLPGAHPAKGVDEVTTPARFSACPAIFSAPCGYDSTNSCSSRCIGTQNRYSSCYLLFLLSISTHRHHVGSPPVGRSPSRSTASAGGDAPQLVAGPVKDRHRSRAARAEAPLRQAATPRNWLRGRSRIATGRAQPEPKHRFGRRRRPATGCGAGQGSPPVARSPSRRTPPYARSASRKPLSPKNLFRARGNHHPNLPFVVHARHRDGQSAGPMAAVERSVGNVPRAVVLGCQLPIKQLRASCQAGAHSFQRTTGARLQGGPLCISLTPILLNRSDKPDILSCMHDNTTDCPLVHCRACTTDCPLVHVRTASPSLPT